MPPRQEPHHVGRHALGPHVVGQRVVVRRVVHGETGPSGGPALTDLLGTCTAWGDGRCVVRPETGPPVEIALADIVSGKPVPPRPSTRHRVGAHEAQVRALALWPGLETRPVGDWLLRRSPSEPARRANSVLAMRASGREDDYDEVVAFYRDHDARPIAAVLPDTAEDDLFRGHGWRPESRDADTVFELAGVAAVRRRLRAGDEVPAVDLSTSGPLAFARVVEGARVVASGVAAYDRDWLGFRGLEVVPTHRGRGLALRLMAALLEWGAEQGATTAYLQVIGDNTRALDLYDGLGFTPHHSYRYLAP